MISANTDYWSRNFSILRRLCAYIIGAFRHLPHFYSQNFLLCHIPARSFSLPVEKCSPSTQNCFQTHCTGVRCNKYRHLWDFQDFCNHPNKSTVFRHKFMEKLFEIWHRFDFLRSLNQFLRWKNSTGWIINVSIEAGGYGPNLDRYGRFLRVSASLSQPLFQPDNAFICHGNNVIREKICIVRMYNTWHCTQFSENLCRATGTCHEHVFIS